MLSILVAVPNTNTILTYVGYLKTLEDGSHHAGVIIGFLGGTDSMKLREVGRKCLGTIYKHLLQTGQILSNKHNTRHSTDETKNNVTSPFSKRLNFKMIPLKALNF